MRSAAEPTSQRRARETLEAPPDHEEGRSGAQREPVEKVRWILIFLGVMTPERIEMKPIRWHGIRRAGPGRFSESEVVILQPKQSI